MGRELCHMSLAQGPSTRHLMNSLWNYIYEIKFNFRTKLQTARIPVNFSSGSKDWGVGFLVFVLVSQTDYLLNSSNNYPWWLWSTVTSEITPSSRGAGCQLPPNERPGLMKSFLDDLTNYLLVSDLPFWVRLLGKLSKVTVVSGQIYPHLLCILPLRVVAAQTLLHPMGKSST